MLVRQVTRKSWICKKKQARARRKNESIYINRKSRCLPRLRMCVVGLLSAFFFFFLCAKGGRKNNGSRKGSKEPWGNEQLMTGFRGRQVCFKGRGYCLLFSFYSFVCFSFFVVCSLLLPLLLVMLDRCFLWKTLIK